jgi:hypothetical protein
MIIAENNNIIDENYIIIAENGKIIEEPSGTCECVPGSIHPPYTKDTI